MMPDASNATLPTARTNLKIAPYVDITDPLYGASATASNNAAAIQAAINAAVAAGIPLHVPAAASCYKYVAPLTVSGNLKVNGDWVTENWAGGINVPLGTPPLLGSVLCPTSSSGVDGIDVAPGVPSLGVSFQNIGILFQGYATFAASGDGIHYVPTGTTQGLSGALWQNVKVYGHDGSHHAFNLQNFIYNTFINTYGYGGGLFKLYGNSTTGDYGNSTFVQPYGQVIAGGSANGFDLGASQAGALNLLTFIRPQEITDSIPGTSPGGNPPTSAQYIFYSDANVYSVKLIAPDLETNVASSVQLPPPANNTDFDFNAFAFDGASINSPAWGIAGLRLGPQAHTFTDTTSSGSVSNMSMYNLTSDTVAAKTATTYGVGATLSIAAPISGTNATFSRTDALFSTGEIYCSGCDFAGSGGMYITGGGSWGGTINLSPSGAGAAAKYVCADSSGNLLIQTSPC